MAQVRRTFPSFPPLSLAEQAWVHRSLGPRKETRITMRLPATVRLLALCCLSALAPAAHSQGVNRVTCYTSFDQEYFYVATIVEKPEIKASVVNAFENPLADDCIVAYLDVAPEGPTRSARSSAMAVSAVGGIQLYRGAAGKPLTGPGDFLNSPEGGPAVFKGAGLPRDPGQGRLGSGTSYTVELAIPWAELGGAPSAGARGRLNIVAFSSALGSPRIISLATGVKSDADVANPSLWDEVVFVDSVLKADTAAASQLRRCGRVFNVKPTVDGFVRQNEYPAVTSFAFSAAGAAVITATTSAARAAPTYTLKAAPPAILPIARALEPAPARTPQALPKLTIALLKMETQSDIRKPTAFAGTRKPDGSNTLRVNPLDGAGPWFTYDSVDWHLRQIAWLAEGGVDVMAVGTDSMFSTDQFRRATTVLATALRTARLRRAPTPLVALHVTEFPLPIVRLFRVRDEHAEVLGRTITDFFERVPREFALTVPLNAANGGGCAHVVFVRPGLTMVSSDGLAQIRQAHRARFGMDLFIVPVDGVKGGDDWVKTAAVSALRLAQAGSPPKRLDNREGGDVYRDAWKKALASKADWVLLEGWNDFASGASIAPTLEDGLILLDITRANTRQFQTASGGLVSHSLESRVAPGARLAGSVKVRNGSQIAWSEDQQAVECKWVREGGAAAGSKLARLTGNVVAGEIGEAFADLTAPNQPGTYRLVLTTVIVNRKGEVVAGVPSTSLGEAVIVVSPGPVPDYAVSSSVSSQPAQIETGGAYTVEAQLRNTGAKAWTKSGARIRARLFMTDKNQAQSSPAPLAEAAVELAADVPPGGSTNVKIPVVLRTAEGEELPSSGKDDRAYTLHIEVAEGGAGATSAGEPIRIAEADFGAVFIQDATPTQMPGDRRIPVALGVRNTGPQTWKKDAVRIGYHWYYQDGSELVWDDETTPIPADIPPGGELRDQLVWVTAPPCDGAYWLVWDLKVGDTWASTLSAARSSETLVKRVEVIRGKLAVVDLTLAFNLDVTAESDDRTPGDFDGQGTALPTEIMPPFASPGAAPSTLWLPEIGSGIESSRRISFAWGSKSGKAMNAIKCVGQKVVVAANAKNADVFKTVHILAAATAPVASAAFTMVFTNGAEQLTSFPMSAWTGEPLHGEEVAFAFPYSRGRSADLPDKPVRLFRYAVKISESRKLAAITLPNSPTVRVLAITLEK